MAQVAKEVRSRGVGNVNVWLQLYLQIQQSTEEIKLEIDVLPSTVLTKLYNYVIRPQRGPPDAHQTLTHRQRYRYASQFLFTLSTFFCRCRRPCCKDTLLFYHISLSPLASLSSSFALSEYLSFLITRFRKYASNIVLIRIVMEFITHSLSMY